MASGIVIHISAGDERHTEVLSSDRIRIGAGEDCDLRLRPSALPKGANASAPFIEQAAIEAAATSRRDDAKVFLREFTRELVREINPSTKIISLAIAVLLVFGVLYIGFSVFSMYKEVKRNRQAAEEQQRALQ